MKRIILFLFVLVFSIFSNTNNLLATEFENNIKDNISNEIEEIKPNNDNQKLIFLILQQKIYLVMNKHFHSLQV